MANKMRCNESGSRRTANILVLLGAVLFDISLAGLFFGIFQAWILFGAGAAALALGLSQQQKGSEKNFCRRQFIQFPESGNA